MGPGAQGRGPGAPGGWGPPVPKQTDDMNNPNITLWLSAIATKRRQLFSGFGPVRVQEETRSGIDLL